MLEWRPELRFFERRYEILRTLEERGDMWAFHAEEELIQARLFDTHHQLAVRQRSASLHLLTPEPQTDRAWTALEFAVNTIQPKQAHNMALTFQFVDPLAVDFDAAMRRGYGTILRVPGTTIIRPDDWAVLADLKLRDPKEGKTEWGSGQTEFGIVSAAEVPSRLRRNIGRVSLVERPALSGNEWDDAEFAPVSLFVDVTFRAPAISGSGTLSALRTFWNGLRADAANLVTELKHQLVPDDNDQREVAT
jgi:hypothetical protein